MLNYLWASMMFLGIITGAVTGHMNEVSEALVNASQEAVELCLTMLGVVAMWTGILKIGEKAGLLEAMAVKMQPVIRFLFPGIPKNHPAVGYIATNFVANMLGLGWAATPAGLKAMESLSELEKERRALKNGMRADSRSRKKFKVMPEGIASNEMCTFLILNISSLQLIPVNIIAYRSQYKSADPTSIIGPAIAATAVSTAAAIIFCKMMDHLMDQRA